MNTLEYHVGPLVVGLVDWSPLRQRLYSTRLNHDQAAQSRSTPSCLQPISWSEREIAALANAKPLVCNRAAPAQRSRGDTAKRCK